MKVNALIFVEKYTSDFHLKNLIENLVANDIEPIFFHDPMNLENIIQKHNPRQPFIFYDHQNIDITPISIIKNWLIENTTQGFSGVIDLNGTTLGFYPNGIKSIQGLKIQLKDYPYNLFYLKKEFKEPNVENPRLILITKEREAYLKLTLNSLINSLPENNRPPLTIVLNEPKESTRVIALEQIKRYGQNTDILEVLPNSKVSGIAIALAWHKSEYFVWLEDDFILPSYTRFMYPYWPKLFREKLNYFGVTGWCCVMDNHPYIDIPIENIKNQINLNNKYISGHKWAYNEPARLGGQALATSTALYKKACLEINQGAIDGEIIKRSGLGNCCPTIMGYHIGWNQYQDGYGDLNSRDWGDFGWSGTYKVTNIVTGETRNISPKLDL
jgi:hypothetical protein